MIASSRVLECLEVSWKIQPVLTSDDVLAHPYHPHGEPRPKRDLEMFDRGEAKCRVQGLTGKRRHQFHGLESGVGGRPLAMAHQGRADAAPRTIGTYEKGADSRRIKRGVERAFGLGGVAPVGAEKSLAPTPAAAPDDDRTLRGDEIGAMVDELRIDRENRDRGIDLRR